jgi:hypothetical protein
MGGVTVPRVPRPLAFRLILPVRSEAKPSTPPIEKQPMPWQSITPKSQKSEHLPDFEGVREDVREGLKVKTVHRDDVL